MKNYSLAQIKSAWTAYEAADAFSVLKEGKWTHTPVIGQEMRRPEGTACKVGKLSKVMDFPEYLEKEWKG